MKGLLALAFLFGLLVGYGIGITLAQWLNPPAIFTRPTIPRPRRPER